MRFRPRPRTSQRNVYAGITPHTAVTGGHTEDAALPASLDACGACGGCPPRSRPHAGYLRGCGGGRVFSPPSCSAQPTSGRYHRPNRGSQEAPRRYRRNEAPQQRTAPCVPAPRRRLTADRRSRGAGAERHQCTGKHRRLSDMRSATHRYLNFGTLWAPFTDHKLTCTGCAGACKEPDGRKRIQCSPTAVQCAD